MAIAHRESHEPSESWDERPNRLRHWYSSILEIFSISTARGRKVYDVALMLPVATKPLVLIVDDNRDTRDLYALYLPLVGYSVETATDGREAVIKAHALYPDVIVMDLQMPRLDGWRAMREIRGNLRTAATPIIVLTGHDFKDYLRHSALAEGAWSYLVKPCLPERLAHEIEVRLSVPPIATARAI